MILLQLQGQPYNLNVMQQYTPTGNKKNDDDREAIYDLLVKVLRKLGNGNLILVIGNFNSRIGQGRRLDLAGSFELEARIHRDDRLFDFCQEKDLKINTGFKLPRWISPAKNNTQEPVRNQIDYMLINKHFRNCVRSVTTYSGSDACSDHDSLVADLKLKLKVIKRKLKNTLLTAKWENLQTNKTLRQELNSELAKESFKSNTVQPI